MFLCSFLFQSCQDADLDNSEASSLTAPDPDPEATIVKGIQQLLPSSEQLLTDHPTAAIKQGLLGLCGSDLSLLLEMEGHFDADKFEFERFEQFEVVQNCYYELVNEMAESAPTANDPDISTEDVARHHILNRPGFE